MPSTNKTSNYNLNSWISTDKPMMADFNSDNALIDAVLKEHFSDAQSHLSSQDRERLTKPFAIGLLVGDGNANKIHTLTFEPKIVIVCLRGYPFIKYDSVGGYNIINSAFALNGFGGSEGIALTERSITLNQTQQAQSGTDFINLNKTFGQYLYIAFK